jgi:hypothetical protein
MITQYTCDVCSTTAPLISVLIDDSAQLLCKKCWEDMLNEAGD